ncbi:protein adenylyltransferase Fic-like [Branchiostoma lanceolatum]|uniref:protein adenylyltransferase Fic-like n=1 Tax=Branchiostoma lanceolatum TaxID=7740 RepID=UPI003454CE9E
MGHNREVFPLVFAVAVSFVSAQFTGEGASCNGHPSGSVYGNADDCKTYHTCLDGVEYSATCPDNQLFNAGSQTCAGPFSVSCDFCASQPCKNGGVCSSGYTTYYCSCPEGLGGKDCANACGLDEFACAGGGCIPSNRVCDADPDCPDMSDEVGRDDCDVICSLTTQDYDAYTCQHQTTSTAGLTKRGVKSETTTTVPVESTETTGLTKRTNDESPPKRNIPPEQQQHSDSRLLSAKRALKSGQTPLAKSYLEEALLFNPYNDEALTTYGALVESASPRLADKVYSRALHHGGGSMAARAAAGRARLAPVLGKELRDRLDRIDAKMAQLKPSDIAAFVDCLLVPHVLYSNKSMEAKRRGDEKDGLLSVLKYIHSQESAEKPLEIHRKLTEFDLSIAGKVRTSQVYIPQVYTPPKPEDAADDMAAFVDFLENSSARNMHPIELAAHAHHELVAIHPFQDGNGRTARMLANAILMRAGYPPAVFTKGDRRSYTEALRLSDVSRAQGEFQGRAFARYLATLVERSVEMILNQPDDSLFSICVDL